MKERPILMSAPMVRALLDGSKTQTRRVVKPQPPKATQEVSTWHHPDEDDGRGPRFYSWIERAPLRSLFISGDWCQPCPYGALGDRLWVRETHAKIIGQSGGWIETDYRATYKHGDRLGDSLGIKKKWTPAIHMPRDASRIDLEVTGVRVERLKDISEADAIAEGIKGITKDGALVKYGIPDADGFPGTDDTGWPWREWRISPVDAYRRLWESLAGEGSWGLNPWVWVVEFKRVDPQQGARNEQ